ncbi:MAG: excinuclease ABC subunit UvrA [Kofleriaceae bacterium]
MNNFVRVRGAREHNLADISVEIPRDALVVFTGVSGSGKSSLAFSTLYAEAQRRYLESVSPYARRLFDQMPVPQVDSIEGLPPAIALQQQRGAPTTRSSVGSVTTLSNLLRMLYSRAGDYPRGAGIVYAEGFSPNTPEGACPECNGAGKLYEVTEQSMVPDPTKTIREKAIAAWPMAWGGQNLRDILVTLGYDVDVPWKTLPKKQRDWILFTDEQPTVPVYAGLTPAETQRALRKKEDPSYMGTFSSAKRHVMHTFANTASAMMKRRVAQYMLSRACPLCHGKRLRREALAVKFAGLDITELSRLSLARLSELLSGVSAKGDSEKAQVTQRICEDVVARIRVMLDLGLGYLTLERSTPTLSPGELQRLRLATQVYSNLFGVVYVLDEPSAGLHPADTEALLAALDRLKAAGNSLFVVEHDLDVIRRADWIVDVGPGAGQHGGKILYSGPPAGLRDVTASQTRVHLFDLADEAERVRREPERWIEMRGITRHNLDGVDAKIPIGCLTSVTGVSGSGKSSLISQALVELVSARLGHEETESDDIDEDVLEPTGGELGELYGITRLVVVDQKPIGRTPRSNLATYTGLFDNVRKLFASTPAARARKYDAGRFSFNVAKGRCERCEGEGFVFVEMLFLPSVYAPCPVCHGARYNAKTLEVTYNGKSIADVLGLTVDAAAEFFADEPAIHRSLDVVRQVGLGYLRLGQPATELSGGEAQRIKLATELQRSSRGRTLFVLDEPTTGLHPSDVSRLLAQLDSLVVAGNTVVVVEHEMKVIAASDWVIDLGPGAGDEGGTIVAAGVPETIARAKPSKTAPHLRDYLNRSGRTRTSRADR